MQGLPREFRQGPCLWALPSLGDGEGCVNREHESAGGTERTEPEQRGRESHRAAPSVASCCPITHTHVTANTLPNRAALGLD